MMNFLIEHWLEIFAVITGLLYVYLEIKQNKIMWIVGFVSSLVFVYVLFEAKIYANMGIYVYYVLISVYGYWKWMGDKIDTSSSAHRLPVTGYRLPILTLVVISLLLSAIIGYVLANFTDSPVPYYDGLVAGFSAVATWMLTQKIIQHWYFWIGINIFCVPLYASQGLYFTAFMFLVYFIMSIIGLKEWKKDLQKML
ncbi:MAG: nicotinamide riboside transporter PnuC [Bacteroidales bacterium]|nr:nicotinamide riboside transporter PnuC [Bacteroidales bacterium]